MPPEAGYARPDLLAEPAWLWEHRNDANLRIIDCGPPDAYRRAHIPGAVGLPVHNFLKADAELVHVMPADGFAELMSALGVSAATTVVAYDGEGGTPAARMWAVLRHYGHDAAMVLNGGWHRWLAEGRAATMTPSAPPRGAFVSRPGGALLCGLDEVRASIDGGSTRIVDARSDAEWLGTNSRGNARAGHVPGAIHLEWEDFLTDDDQRVFRPAAELRPMLRAAGVLPESDVITYCQGGIRAAHLAFVLTLLGYEHVRIYDGSMREWANRDDTPLVMEGG